MAGVRTIKGIDDETWMEFKKLAKDNDVTMGFMFKMMFEEYEKHAKKLWHEILYAEKILTDEEAKDIEETSKKLRKEFGWREHAGF